MFTAKLLGKKGVEGEAIFWFIDLFILLVILLLIFRYIGEVGEQSFYQKRLLAKDTALLTDTLLSVPGNAFLHYPQDTYWFGLELKTDRIEVFEKRDEPTTEREREHFIQNPSVTIKPALLTSNIQPPKKGFISKYVPILEVLRKNKVKREEGMNLYFYKTPNQLTVSSTLEEKQPNFLNCPKSRPITDLVFITEDNDPYLDVKNFLGERGEIKKRDAASGTITYLLFSDKQSTDSVKSYYFADNADLIGLSCSLVNGLVDDGFGTEISASIPASAFTLEEKIGNPAQLIIEISIKEEFTTEKLQALKIALHSGFI